MWDYWFCETSQALDIRWPSEKGPRASGCKKKKKDQVHYGRHERHSSQQGCERSPSVPNWTTGRQIYSESDCLHAFAKKSPPKGTKKIISPFMAGVLLVAMVWKDNHMASTEANEVGTGAKAPG